MTAPNVFVKQARANFLAYGLHWIKTMADKFPECEEIADMLIYYEGVVQNSDEKLVAQIDVWFNHMMTPLHPKKTKYAKAIERITKSTPCMYHALMYRDAVALEQNDRSEICKKIGLFEKIRDPRLGDREKQDLWKALEMVTNACFEAKDMPLPHVPTREDIQANIRARRGGDDEGPSMYKAFAAQMNKMCTALNMMSPLEGCDEASIKQWMGRWHKFASETTDGTKNSELCAQNDERVLASLTERFPEFDLSTKDVTDIVWKDINNLLGFSAVSENIPTKMMGRIEDMASRLAADIYEGRADMSSMNLSDIGQQVLSGCTEEDMSKFADNIDTLLPALGTLQQHERK